MIKLFGAVAAIAVGALALTQVRAADLTLNVKTGLWQTTVSMETSGQLPIPEADLAKMTPERRQQFEAAMNTAMANASQPPWVGRRWELRHGARSGVGGRGHRGLVRPSEGDGDAPAGRAHGAGGPSLENRCGTAIANR